MILHGDVANGECFAYWLTEKGSLYSFVAKEINNLLPGLTFQLLTRNDNTCYALTSDNKVYNWLVQGKEAPKLFAEPTAIKATIKEFLAFEQFLIILTTKGQVFIKEHLDDNSPFKLAQMFVDQQLKVKQILPLAGYYLILSQQEEVFVWGSQDNLLSWQDYNHSKIKQLEGFNKIKSLSNTAGIGLLLDSSGEVSYFFADQLFAHSPISVLGEIKKLCDNGYAINFSGEVFECRILINSDHEHSVVFKQLGFKANYLNTIPHGGAVAISADNETHILNESPFCSFMSYTSVCTPETFSDVISNDEEIDLNLLSVVQRAKIQDEPEAKTHSFFAKTKQNNDKNQPLAKESEKNIPKNN